MVPRSSYTYRQLLLWSQLLKDKIRVTVGADVRISTSDTTFVRSFSIRVRVFKGTACLKELSDAALIAAFHGYDQV